MFSQPHRRIVSSIITCAIVLTWALGSPDVTLGEVIEEASAKTLPWSGYWWPHRQGGIRGPVGKYDQLTGAKAAQWEIDHNPQGPQVPKWFGFCHAWSASSVTEAEPKQSLPATYGGQKVTLAVGDQKGLFAACHASDIANTWGDRFGDGRGSEDPADLQPDVLWNLLSLYIKQQQLPIILDIDAGAEVWNFPVYAYRVQKTGQGTGGKTLATLTLWFADDGVPADFVGLKPRSQTYQFEYTQSNNSVVAGSAVWVGSSVKDHPDFAWYPHTTKPQNPEIQYAVVKEILGKPGTPNTNPGNNNPNNPGNNPNNPGNNPNNSGNNPNNPGNNLNPIPMPGVATQATLLSPLELVAMVANRTSDFAFDVTVDRFDGGKYVDGDSFTMRASSEQAGFLYLFHVAPDGKLSLLFPQFGQDNRIPVKDAITIPGEKSPFVYKFHQPFGQHRIKAVVTERQLILSGLIIDQATYQQQQQQQQQQGKPQPQQQDKPDAGKPQQQTTPQTGQQQKGTSAEQNPLKPSQGDSQTQEQRPAQYQEFRWHTTQREQFEQVLRDYSTTQQVDAGQLQGIDIHKILGRFAQDEVSVYVGPKPVDQKGKSDQK